MSTYFLSRGGLLFVAKSDIRIATGLVKGEMCLKEFYRTAIFFYLSVALNGGMCKLSKKGCLCRAFFVSL